MSSAVRTPVQIARVTADVDATAKTLTLGAKKWVALIPARIRAFFDFVKQEQR